MTIDFLIREYREEDFDAVILLWRVAREIAMPEFQRTKGYFLYQDIRYFQTHVLPNEEIFIVEGDGYVAAFIAIKQDFVDHLYVHPDFQRRGVGQMLLEFAKKRSPEHVWLYTLQANVHARAFYEKNAFVAEKFGVSPPPENEPDVEYHWRRS